MHSYFKYTLAVTNDKESLHNQSLVVLIISVPLSINVSLSYYYKSDECVNLWQITRHPIFYRI